MSAGSALPAPGRHGGDGARLAAALGIAPEEVLDLSASLNPFAPDVAAIAGAQLGALRRYPDPAEATAALARAIGVDPERVLLTAGGSAAISLVAGELGGSVEEPEFALHPRSGGPRWRSNPHNPTGRLAPAGEVAAVWDEAFYPLAAGAWTRGDPGCVVVGSLTKVFACPGLRLGYVLAEPELVRRLAARAPHWAVGGLGCALVPELVAGADLVAWRDGIAGLRAELTALLDAHGLAPQPSEANWVLCAEALGLRRRLAPQAVVVRDCASFGLPGWARVAVPDRAGLDRLAAALADTAPGSSRVGGSASARTRGPASARTRGPESARMRAPASPETGGPGSAGAGASRRRPRGDGISTGGVMVCGTASDAGKSAVVTGLCRLLAREGVKVAPFKAQNMALNSYVTASGHEIGRAQATQAMAAGVEPEVAMNPVLLKPTSVRTSQVVVLGRPLGHLQAADYQARKPALFPLVLDALAELRSRFEVVVAEGAGSPAEINLLDHDIVNLALADAAGLPALVVGDIDRGGVFAALHGTVDLLPERYRRRVRGFVVNKFRGDPALLGSALADLEVRSGVPTLGVLPFVAGVSLDAEDSLALDVGRPDPGDPLADPVDVAVVAWPTISNFTDLDALGIEPGVGVRMVRSPGALGDPDLVVLPGSKSTLADLAWMRRRGLDSAVAAARAAGATVVGICGGYQVLGKELSDPGGVEAAPGAEVCGLGWLEVRTTFEADKVTSRREGTALGEAIAGYEIHHGRTSGPAEPWVWLPEPEGAVDPGGSVYGTALHGIFESDRFRASFLRGVAARRAKRFVPAGVSFAAAREAQWDRLADLVADHVDRSRLERILSEGALH